ncbi:MAG TPA: peptide chain release factor N(5)-glutamine methyltransferase [Bacteroidota bacterium]|nr:peptide chain release factor N(5)-glutamine methyltransferase [Bacteroidota bacterium]
METIEQDVKQWSILSLIDRGTQFLQEKEIESARLNCELLLCHVLHCRRIDLYVKFDQPLSTDELGIFKKLLQRRAAREPLQYITGTTDFMGLQFAVDPRVLIPRPETELLVEEIITLSKNKPDDVRRILEIGTGSGNIAVSLAKFIPECCVETIEHSDDAISLARENILRHQCGDHVKVFKGNILQDCSSILHDRYDVIIANPPYISAEEFHMLPPEVKNFEPALALTDGADGLSFYRVIAKLGIEHLQQNGWVVVEIAYDMADQVVQIFSKPEYSGIQTIRDYDQNIRIVKAQFCGKQ